MDKLPKFQQRLGKAAMKPDLGEPDYTSGRRSNPHAEPAEKTDSFYSDHGRGQRKADDEAKTTSRKIW